MHSLYKRFFYLVVLVLVFLSCNKPAEPVFDNVYDDQSDQYIPFADISTNVVTQIRAQSATSGGQFANDYGKPVTQKGVCWSLVQIPTVEGTCSQEGSGLSAFTSTLTSLVADTLYYVRAYATNADGTTYGQQLSFRTMDGKPVFSTPVVSGIGTRGASLSGSVSGDGGASILRRGFVWSTDVTNPTIQDSIRVLGEGLGDLSLDLGSLSPGVTYYIRLFAESGTGLHYSVGSSFKTLDGKAVFGQTGVSAITPSTATVSATITGDGGEVITGRGVCYATTQNPTTGDTCVSSGSGTGAFSVTIEELSAETRYYARAYAFNAFRITYSEQMEFNTLDGKAVFGQTRVSSVMASTVSVTVTINSDGGEAITGRGVCYATTQNPTTQDNCVSSGVGTGTFSVTANELSAETRYYIRAYAFNTFRITYSEQMEVTTLDGKAVIGQAGVSDVTGTTAMVSATISSDGGEPITGRGACYATTQNPTTQDTCVSSGSGTGAFAVNIIGLRGETRYYVRAYAFNAFRISYSQQVEFTTSGIAPTVTTGTVSNITTSGATVAGNVTSQGSSVVTARGIVWSTSQNPTVGSNTGINTSGSGTGSFSASLSGLSSGLRYYARAYATNNAGTSYGNQIEFTTTGTAPTVTTGAVSNITTTGATVAGNVTVQGSSTVTARGVCYATTQNPTTANTCLAAGSGTGTFSTNLTGLSSGTRYYARAYATNAAGTSYGGQVEFTTTGTAPTVTTGFFSNITTTGATVAGNVTAQGSSAVTQRGVCYATTQNPTTANTCVASGSGTGSFSANLTGLTIGTRYYTRAYATNSSGTSYGNQVEFTTSGLAPTVATGVTTNISTNGATIAGDVTSQGSFAVTARGVCYATTQNPTTVNTCVASGSGTGTFSANLTGLSSGTLYYARAYASNNAGTSYGNQVEFTTTSSGGDANGRDNTTLVVDVRNPATGRTWMDRNLGASRAATSSTDTQAYGDLYQWGRRADGHQKRNSSTISTLSNTNTPEHGSFILAPDSPNDWRSPQNNSLWQGLNGVNNPCPVGYRIPTIAEWTAERQSWTSNNGSGAFSSLLRLTLGGSRFRSGGALGNVGTSGNMWSSSVSGSQVQYLTFDSGNADVNTGTRALGSSVRCIKDAIEVIAPTVQTTAVSSITTNSAVSGGNVTSDGGATVTARGVVWSATQNPTISSNMGITTATSGTGSFSANLTGLSAGTRYYVRAYATNAAGTSYGNQVEFTTSSSGGSTTGRDTETQVVDVRNPATGRTWMDRNLGASRAATSSTDTQAYGDLYQWGRRADGHQKRNSGWIPSLSMVDSPESSDFIIAPNSPYDWRSPQNENLWQGENGINNPCPFGYRIPTSAEWDSERQSWGTRNAAGAFISALKLTLTGGRFYNTNGLYNVGEGGNYWTSTIDDRNSAYLYIYDGGTSINSFYRSAGFSVRCIKN
jgi:uncharacterized protein (TIGR02145 family)